MIDTILRFRAWDDTNKKWACVGFHLFGEVTIFNIMEQYRLEEACKSLVFTQFTNVIDMKGIDLYVGDLFKSENSDFIYRIWAVDGGFGINAHVDIWKSNISLDCAPMTYEPLADLQTVSWIMSSCIKIGNIFENPEILLV